MSACNRGGTNVVERSKQVEPFIEREQGERLLKAIRQAGPPEDQSAEFLRGFDEAQRWAIAIISMAAGIG